MLMFGSRNRRTISRKERSYAPRLENSRLRHCGAVCEVAALMESWIFGCGAIAPIAPQNGAYVVVAKVRRERGHRYVLRRRGLHLRMSSSLAPCSEQSRRRLVISR